MHPPLVRRTALPVLFVALGLVGARGALAQRDSVVIPANTVVRLKLGDRISSKTARVGDRFTATLAEEDTSGFPTGTRFEGTVTEVQRYTKDKPGMVDIEMRRAVLPGGAAQTVDARLTSLAEEDVRRTSDGRLESRRNSKSRPDWKWAGYGAAGAAVVSAILGENILKGALLGGLGGAIYGYLNRDKDKGNFRDVDLPSGTEFGVRLEERVAFNNLASYRYTARNLNRNRGNNLSPNEQVAGERQEFRYDTAVVRVNGRDVRFGGEKPLNLNGLLYLPLRPIAESANMRLTHRGGFEDYEVETPSGRVQGNAGEDVVRMPQGQERTLEASPVSVNGTVYVPIEFLSRILGMRADWNRRDLRLELDTDRQ